ncbi:MAG: hypothetical protein JWP36_2091 [Paucimonas sp.]|nr:hypothetical protein [Paucimonas sp.]
MMVPVELATAAATQRDPAPAAQADDRRCPRLVPVCAAHATRDLLGQMAGRSLGLGILVGVVALNSSSIYWRLAAGGLGAICAGVPAYYIAKNQVSAEGGTGKVAVGLWTAAAAATGAVVAGLGSVQPVAALATGAIASTTVSLLGLNARTENERSGMPTVKGSAMFMAGGAALAAASIIDKQWIAPVPQLVARNLGVAGESLVIELCKSSFEQVGPSVDRKALNFKGRVLTSMIGMLPYVGATVLLNGYVSGLLQGPTDSFRYQDLIAPALVGALANAVRGSANSAAAWLMHQQGYGDTERDDNLRPHAGPRRPDAAVVAKKSAVRFFLSTCRNALYQKFRDHGLSVLEANCAAQAIYAVFAQNRDLIFDLMTGEGWTEPQLSVRA